MRPYLTILRDSFHEALASRVLWTILIVITVVLVFLAPLGPKGLSGPEFAPQELFTPPGLAESIVEGAEADHPTVGKRILTLLPTEARARMERISKEKISASALIDLSPEGDAAWLSEQLNTLINRRDFFQPDAWKDVRLRSEARKTNDAGLDKLSAAEHARFQRLALESAFPGKVAMLANREERLVYFGMVLEVIPAATRSDFQRALGSLIFFMLKFGVGVGGVLAGLFVTSTIMPQTFEAGAVDLLFSKPVTRFGVYLTKFFGGCAFVVIMATYFVGGIWFLAGVRFGLWNGSLLATIPIFVFIFAVYYSVSCLAGAYWRNPIVSVTMAVLLWAAGWVLTGLNGLGDAYLLNPERIIKVTDAGDTPIVNTEKGLIRRWDEATRSWVEVFRPDQVKSVGMGITVPIPYAGPIYDPPNQRIVALERVIPELGQFSAREATIWVGYARDDFERKQAIKLTADVSDARILLREPRGTFLVVSRTGIRRWDGKMEETKEAPKIGNLDLSSFLGGGGKSLERVGPDVTYADRSAAAVHPQTGELAYLDAESLRICKLGDDGKFTVRAEAPLELDEVGILAFAGDTVLVAQPDRKLLAFDAADAKPRETLTLPGEAGPNTMFAAQDGKAFFILSRDKYVYQYDPAKHAVAEANVSGQADIGAINVTEKNQLLVADRTDRVRSYSLPGETVDARYQPGRAWPRFAYEFLLYPIYRVVPKPRELDQLTLSLISDLEQPVNGNIGRDTDLNAPADRSKWIPVRDNAIFILVMLVLGCWHVARRDY